MCQAFRVLGAVAPRIRNYAAHVRFGLDQCQARLYTAIARHVVLVMAALAICAITAAQVKDRTDTQAPPPVRPDQRRPLSPA